MLAYVLAGAAVAAFAPAVAATAQPRAADRAIIVTGQRIAEAEAEVRSRPGGADLVLADDYKERLSVSLRDALAFSPGVYAQPRFGQEVRLSIRGSGISRGFHMRGLTLLQDGVPINLADDNGDFQELDPTILEHIEVYRGANGLRFGGSTLGGAINGVTPTGRSAPGIALRLDGGSGDTARGVAAYGFSDAAGDAWLALSGDTSRGDRDHDRRHSLRFNGNVGLRLTDRIETRLHASAQSLRQELPGALDLDDAVNHPRTGNFAGDQQRDIDSLRLQNRTRIDLGGGALEAGGFVNLKALYHPIYQVLDQTSTDWGLFARLNVAHGPFSFTLGTTDRFGTMASKRFVNVDARRGALTFDADLSARTIDVYGEGRYAIGSLSLIAGGVYTHGERRQDQRFPTIVAGRFSDDQFSPRLGLIWAPRADVQVYANYSRSHEMPGFIELAQTAAFVPLATQRAWTAEVGARGTIGIARFDVSLYRATLKDELLQFDVGPDVPAATFNADRTRHQGIEAGLDLDLAPWARLRQVYQYNDFRFVGDAHYGDNRLPVIPKHLYRAELRLGSERLNLTPIVEWVPTGAWADYANTLKVDGYATLGLTAAARLRPGLDLFIDARNLTGTHAVGDISAAVRADASAAIFYPIERRAFYAGVRARF
jgi:iron complex outermembrane receptor protein